jgi:hypothetical protein
MASEGQSEQVQFENANGEILVGRLHTFLYANGESDDVKGERHRVHILCHGFRDTKDSKTIKKVADALHAKGSLQCSLVTNSPVVTEIFLKLITPKTLAIWAGSGFERFKTTTCNLQR